MPRPQKIERNKEMVLKRISDPKIWTITKLSEHYRIDLRAVWEILQRDTPIYANKHDN